MVMEIIETRLPDVLILKPRVFGDERGFFTESFNLRTWEEVTGLKRTFVQDNHSRSSQGVLRGLHYQIQRPQGKLVRCIRGSVYDVAVDMRVESPTFGEWAGVELSAENHLQFWIPEGFAHGFVVLSKCADFLYKTTDYYSPEHERSVRWDDPDLNIKWPLESPPLVSEKDAAASYFKDAQYYMGVEFIS
jgi:dTDP-4-dehydrorhamnose 3,5-epimerase